MSKRKTIIEKFADDKDNLRFLKQEELILDITERICEVMEKESISRAELARRLKKSRGFVTQILNGGRNLTLRTLSDVMYAIGYRARLAYTKIDEVNDALVSFEPKFISFDEGKNLRASGGKYNFLFSYALIAETLRLFPQTQPKWTPCTPSIDFRKKQIEICKGEFAW